jgi:glycerophosphoryl diester phosphodiesterase
MPSFCELQGHRGARGLKPENTLPSFEAAFDRAVTSVETDLHLTKDGVPIIIHDPFVRGVSIAHDQLLVATTTLEQLRRYRADRNPDPRRFPYQDAGVTPVAVLFAHERGIDPYTLPTLVELFAFAEAYAGELGAKAGKNMEQRAQARRVIFDLELKRVPFRPELIGDGFDGSAPGLLEQNVIHAVREAGMLRRTRVRSFDHRSVRAAHALEPALPTGVLIAGTAPVSVAELAQAAGAHVYCPGVDFLDAAQIDQAHAAGLRVIPWTVNHPDDWDRLLAWSVDGITTDYPDRLAACLSERGIAFSGDTISW